MNRRYSRITLRIHANFTSKIPNHSVLERYDDHVWHLVYNDSTKIRTVEFIIKLQCAWTTKKAAPPPKFMINFEREDEDHEKRGPGVEEEYLSAASGI